MARSNEYAPALREEAVKLVLIYSGEVRHHQMSGYFSHLYNSRDLENLDSDIADFTT